MQEKVSSPILGKDEIGAISVLGLAHIGDCVYELFARTHVVLSGHTSSTVMHRETVALVKARFQALGAEKIAPLLNEEEAIILRRGRNCKVHGVPKSADISEYHAATALEALFGWLYLMGRNERLNELFSQILTLTENEQ
ncbi:MAG: ribonuclease III [Oscillospiraceae bacterium]|nr:ribonuclease III [Oscillospiraceae bacterium]